MGILLTGEESAQLGVVGAVLGLAHMQPTLAIGPHFLQ